MANAPGRFWIARSPDSQGDIIAKMDTAGQTQVPESIADYDGFIVQSVSDRSELANATVDQSGLSDTEKGRLSQIYPVR